MKILGIETSCDETAVAIVTDGKEILANLVLSQKEHEKTGGVVPEVAARAHLAHMDGLVKEALEKSGLGFKDLDGIAVTAGPGLIGGVLVGVMTAKAISLVHGTPLVAVNHLEGHALTVRLTHDVAFPYLLLLASGGHCQLLIVEGVGKYRRLGTTIDDAAGEAFDKTAKLLGLGYPGGPAVEKTAALCKDTAGALKKFPFPKPLVGTKGCDFSFSGLKTAARRIIENAKPEDTADICHAFQETVAAILADRAGNAIAEYLRFLPSPADLREREGTRAEGVGRVRDCPDLGGAGQSLTPTLSRKSAGEGAIGTLVVAGGVAANKRLRAVLEGLAAKKGLAFVAPPLALCTDNAAMIAWAGVERMKEGLTDAPDFPVYARWPLDPHAPVACAKSQKI